MLDKLEEQARAAAAEIAASPDLRGLERLRVALLGKKSVLQEALRSLGSLSAEERPKVGNRVNELRRELTERLDTRLAVLQESDLAERLQQDRIDTSLPGRSPRIGRVHPLSLVSGEIFAIFERMGFTVVEGDEVEDEYYNFDALNLPAHHPARDDHDSFYLGETRLLRTQTSPMQIHTFEKFSPPVAAISPGKCFRRDTVDARHLHTFHQVEGFLVDEGVSMADLKGVLTGFVHEMFGSDTRLRFRPDFFPFTEPSAEIAISCFVCHGKGCRVCSHSGWIEMGGAGMIHPAVFKAVGYDYEKYSGFAFGMGIERLTMKRFDIPDIRLLYENDLRFLRQF
jgi:phenylalanyl-tRNA synthetase alpha chain